MVRSITTYVMYSKLSPDEIFSYHFVLKSKKIEHQIFKEIYELVEEESGCDVPVYTEPPASSPPHKRSSGHREENNPKCR